MEELGASESRKTAILNYEVFRIQKANFFLYTGCKSRNDTFLKTNILKQPLPVEIQPIHQQKACDLSFLETESLRAWHYQEGVAMS